jgi:hypothetical protein
MNSCSVQERANKAFIEKYEKENFDAFINTSVFVRSKDKDGDIMVFVGDLEKEECGAPFIVTVYQESKKVKSTSRHLLKDTCEVDEERMIKLALKYREYGIGFLKVYENRNAFFNVVEAERPTLIRFSDMKYKTEEYKDWKQVKGNWYEKK